MATKTTTKKKKPNQNYSARLADGRRVTVKNGVKTYTPAPTKKTSSGGGSMSFGKNAAGNPLETRNGVNLRTKEGQTLKDYSIAFGGGGSGGGVTSDSTDAKNGENQLRTDIGDQLKKLQKDQERQIQKERDALARRKEEERLNIDQDADKLKSDTEIKQAGDMGTTSMGLARMGGYLGNTASQQGVLQNLANVQRTELATLENSRQDALRAANNAYEDRDFDLAREKLQVARDTEQEIYNRQQEFDKINRDALKTEQTALTTQKEQTDIYNAIAGGATDVASIFEKLGGSVPVENIAKFLTAIKPKAAEGAFSFSASNTAGLLGAGLSQDDIQALNDYVNQNGYTDELRATLTPAQRIAADKIFRDIKTTTGVTNPTGQLSLVDIKRIKDLYGVTFPPGILAADAEEFLAKNIGEDADLMQEAINEIWGTNMESDVDGADSDYNIEFTEEWFRANLDRGQLKSLADIVNASKWWTPKGYDIDRMFNTPEFFTLLESKIRQLRSQGYTDLEVITSLTS